MCLSHRETHKVGRMSLTRTNHNKRQQRVQFSNHRDSRSYVPHSTHRYPIISKTILEYSLEPHTRLALPHVNHTCPTGPPLAAAHHLSATKPHHRHVTTLSAPSLPPVIPSPPNPSRMRGHLQTPIKCSFLGHFRRLRARFEARETNFPKNVHVFPRSSDLYNYYCAAAN